MQEKQPFQPAKAEPIDHMGCPHIIHEVPFFLASTAWVRAA